MKKKLIKKNWPKYVLQWGVLLALIVFISGLIPSEKPVDPETYCPMGGLEAITTYLVNNSLPCSMSTLQIMMGIVLAFAVMLFSKLFCGYLCPIGSVEDLLTGLRQGLHVKSLKIKNGSILDKVLRIIKYLLLFWIFYMTATASELFCKNLDPYYAVATGFKGEITLWMSLTTIAIVILLGFFVDRFWCRYICPLGAASNTFKFWGKLVVLFLICWLVVIIGAKFGYELPWWVLLALFCIFGYFQEIFDKHPKLQVLNVIKDEEKCTGCGLCERNCPYHIDLAAVKGGRINNVDCTLCGECTAACTSDALYIGVCDKAKGGFWKYVPAILVIVLFIVGVILSKNFELATIDDSWGIENVGVNKADFKTFEVEGLRSVKCYGSSKAFSAKLQRIPGTHGVRTYVKSSRAVITYDPNVTSQQDIERQMYVPSKFKVNTPDPNVLPELKCVTIRTEKMGDKMDVNYLGLQFRVSGAKIYGIESEFDCPLIIRVYMDPSENLDAKWFKKIVEKKTLDMPIHGGGIKQTPVDYEFVRMEEGYTMVKTSDFLKSTFRNFRAQFKQRVEQYEGKPQFIYEMENDNYEKPIISRNYPYLSNHLSNHEGIIGIYLNLNKNYKPAIQIRYAEPMTADKIWELINMETWTITYKEGDVREEAAKIKFYDKGVVYPYQEGL